MIGNSTACPIRLLFKYSADKNYLFPITPTTCKGFICFFSAPWQVVQRQNNCVGNDMT